MLWRVTNSWQRTIRANLAPLALTHVQFVLLAALASTTRSKPITQRELADIAGTDAMMTSQVLRTLEGKGLIERGSHPTDGRAVGLSVTDTGLHLVNRATAAVESADETYFNVLGEARSDFTRMLAVLNLSADTTSTP